MTAREPQVVAVGGGKGGVGKSLIAANVGIFLATLGKKVIVVDLSLGAPNLHLFCGVPRPTRTLAEALVPGGPPLAELAVATPVTGMRLIAGAADPAWTADLDLAAAQDLLSAARELPCDWVVLDLAGGLSSVVLELFVGADVGVAAAVPDPTSVELMHRFLGAAFLHRLRQHGLGELADRHAAPRGGIVGPLEIYLDAVAEDDPFLDHLRAAVVGFAPQLVINAARSKHDMELGRAGRSPRRRDGGWGCRWPTSATSSTTRRCGRRPGGGGRCWSSTPEARIAKCIEKVTRGLLAVRPPDDDLDVLPPDSHYDLLEVAPSGELRGHPARPTGGSATSTAPSRSRSPGSTIRPGSRRSTAGSTSRTRP
jgi:flagellar biosynthesis protein FlhG